MSESTIPAVRPTDKGRRFAELARDDARWQRVMRAAKRLHGDDPTVDQLLDLMEQDAKGEAV
jgi:hypothetical protein